MMLALLLESAVRNLILGLVVWCGLKFFRVHCAQIQRIAWTVVLMAALAMPLLMQWNTVTLPAPAVTPVWIARTAPVLTIETTQISKSPSPDIRPASRTTEPSRTLRLGYDFRPGGMLCKTMR
jgi:hypothetical protein